MDKLPPLDGVFGLDGNGVRFDMVLDGLSNTLLVGEKHVPRGTFGQGYLDNSTYNGDYPQCYTRAAGVNIPLAQSTTELTWRFGSYHMGVVQFNFCDGSVRPLRSDTDPQTLALLANREDGQTVTDY
jgi:hypothetical protein